MHDHEPNQIFSKRFASEIDDDQLPRDYDRRILVNSNGGCSISYHNKRSEELLDYFVDMMQWLEPNEVVIGAAAWSDPETLYITRLEYASTGVVAWIVGGADNKRQLINVEVSTSLGRIKMVQFVLHTEGVANNLALISAMGDAVTVGRNSSDPSDADSDPEIEVFPSVLNFPNTTALLGQSSQTLVIKNTGDVTAFIRGISVNGPFTQRNSGEYKLVPGDFTQITVTYKPQTVGLHAGSLSIDIGEGRKEYVTFTGNAGSSSRLITSGNQFIRPGGETVRLKSINWFGAETEVYAPHGLWARGYKDIIDQIASLGFNCVRLPFSGDICNEQRTVTTGVINVSLNEELAAKTAIQVFDEIIRYLNEKKIYILLDHHRCTAGDGADGSPIEENYTLENWKSSWRFMAKRYSGLEYVLGADLHNEPYRLEWSTWANYAEATGNTVLGIAPHWLIFVEGVGRHQGNEYWWGGELSGVVDRPIKLSIANRLVYSVHEYGQSVGTQPWLALDGTLPAGWPYNLYNVWRKHWGFIVEQSIAPVFIGEVGGKFGIDGAGKITNTANAQYERQWIYHLQRYMDGYFSGNDQRRLPATAQGMSFAYWAINPNSSDTGGLLQDDWITEQSAKLEIIGMILNNMNVAHLLSLTPLSWDKIEDDSQVVVGQGGKEFAVPLGDFISAARLRLYEVGVVHFFGTTLDPNEKYQGQTWQAVPDLNIENSTTTIAAWLRIS